MFSFKYVTNLDICFPVDAETYNHDLCSCASGLALGMVMVILVQTEIFGQLLDGYHKI